MRQRAVSFCQSVVYFECSLRQSLRLPTALIGRHKTPGAQRAKTIGQACIGGGIDLVLRNRLLRARDSLCDCNVITPTRISAHAQLTTESSCYAAGLGSVGPSAGHRTEVQPSALPSMQPARGSQFPANEGLRLSCPAQRRFGPYDTAIHIVSSISAPTVRGSSAHRPNTRQLHKLLPATQGTAERPAKVETPFALLRWLAHASPCACMHTQARRAQVRSPDPARAFSQTAQSADRIDVH